MPSYHTICRKTGSGRHYSFLFRALAVRHYARFYFTLRHTMLWDTMRHLQDIWDKAFILELWLWGKGGRSAGDRSSEILVVGSTIRHSGFLQWIVCCLALLAIGWRRRLADIQCSVFAYTFSPMGSIFRARPTLFTLCIVCPLLSILVFYIEAKAA
jgi:hypothetical protein